MLGRAVGGDGRGEGGDGEGVLEEGLVVLLLLLLLLLGGLLGGLVRSLHALCGTHGGYLRGVGRWWWVERERGGGR